MCDLHLAQNKVQVLEISGSGKRERERDISPKDCYCGFKKNFQRMAYVMRPEVTKGSTTDPKVKSIMPQKHKS